MTSRHRTTGLLLLLYLTLGAAWAWRLMPDARPAPDLADPRLQLQERLAARLARAPKTAAMPALMALADLPLEKLQILDQWLEEPPLGQLRQLTVQEKPLSALGGEWGKLLLVLWFEQAAPVDLAEAHPMIAAAGDRLEDDFKRLALEEMARRAEKTGDMAAAVTILGRAAEFPGASWETLHQLAAACRRAQTPAPALRALRLWITRHAGQAGFEDRVEQARDLETGLLLDGGQAMEALDLQMTDLAGAAPYPEKALNRAWLAARSAHLGLRFLPVLERHLDSFEAHALKPWELAALDSVPAGYRRWLERHAALCDLEQPAVAAFNSYLRLAYMHSPAALVRACALADKASQKQILESVLSQALEWPETLKTVLELAQTDLLAARVLQTRLRAEPRNRRLHFTAVLAAAESRQGGSRSVLWQEYLRRFPDDADALRRLARTCLEEGHYTLARSTCARLPKDSLTPEDRDFMALLETLDVADR